MNILLATSTLCLSKPSVTDPNPETAVVIDTKGQEVEFVDNGNEQPTPEAEVPVSDESQPTT